MSEIRSRTEALDTGWRDAVDEEHIFVVRYKMLFEFEFDFSNCDTHLCSRFVLFIIVTGEKLIHKTESDGCFLTRNFFTEWFLALSAGMGAGIPCGDILPLRHVQV
jgi:hypothetical protein